MPYSSKTLVDNWHEDRQAPLVHIEQTLRPFEPQFVNRITRRKALPSDSKHNKATFAQSSSVYKEDFVGTASGAGLSNKKPQFISESTIFEVLFDDRRPVDWAKSVARASSTQRTRKATAAVQAVSAVATEVKYRRASSLITRGNDKRRGRHIFNDWRAVA